jgi:hypothetical protein
MVHQVPVSQRSLHYDPVSRLLCARSELAAEHATDARQRYEETSDPKFLAAAVLWETIAEGHHQLSSPLSE